jgi:DNA mismatch repair protein PMS2
MLYLDSITISSSKLVSTTKNNKQILENINDIFGGKVMNQVMPFSVDLGSVVQDGLFTGYITKPEWGIGRSSADRQYYYVNGRPCLLPKVIYLKKKKKKKKKSEKYTTPNDAY